MSGSVTVAAVERAADVLMHFSVTPRADLGVTEIADDLGLSKAAVHRVLASLRSRGLVDLDARRIARPFLQELSEQPRRPRRCRSRSATTHASTSTR